MPSSVAYIVSRFPLLSETFILREMDEVERRGWRVALFPLIVENPPLAQPAARAWLPRLWRVPFFSVGVMAANLRALARSPRRYAGLWCRAVWENRRSLKFLLKAIATLPKAVAVAPRMREAGIAHLHAHYATHPALAAWAIHRMTGIPYSISVHAHDLYVERAMLAVKVREAAFVVAVSHYNRDHLSRSVGEWARAKIHVVHCGVAAERYAPRVEPATSLRRFEILCVGSLQPYKGHVYLLKACALLRDRGVLFRCRIVGEGVRRRPLEMQILDSGLEDCVELLGAKTEEEVAGLLATADCFVQPSVVTPSGKMEGIPVAIMEALAAELPVVATDISGVPELILENETGLLVPAADAMALADALRRIRDDPRCAARMARAGKALVIREFNLHTNVERLVSLFATVSESGPFAQDRDRAARRAAFDGVCPA